MTMLTPNTLENENPPRHRSIMSGSFFYVIQNHYHSLKMNDRQILLRTLFYYVALQLNRLPLN
jgi:hypothetical protein